MGVLLPMGAPASWQQRLDMTSFTFMLNCVPFPSSAREGETYRHAGCQDLVANFNNERVFVEVEPPARMVCICGSFFQSGIRRDHLSRYQIVPDAEMF